MTVTMYDSTNPGNIPSNAQAVAGYVDGLYKWTDNQWALFPHAVHITIAVFASDDADVLDVEQGDATPAQCPSWCQRQRGRGVNPTIYCSRVSMWPSVQQAMAGQPAPNYWIADYTGQAHLVPGSVATQWTDYQNLYDISEALESWLYPGPPPQSTGEDMIASTPSGNGYWVCKPDGSVWSYGDAKYLGGSNPGASAPMPTGHVATGFASHPSQEGYWITTNFGEVYAFGAAAYHGSPNVP